MKTIYHLREYSNPKRKNLKAVVAWKDAGKWHRNFFATKAEAKTFKQIRETELLNQGREGLEFPSWLRVMAQECQDRLSPFGKNLRDATAFFAAHLERTQRSRPLPDAVAEYIASKKAKGVTSQHVNHVRSVLHRFRDALPGKTVAAIVTTEIETWVAQEAPSAHSRNSFLKLLLSFFRFCGERGYCEVKNPVRSIPFAKEKESPIGIVTPPELRALLDAACPEMLAFVAIGAFAGLRKAEISRLDWSEVDLQDGVIEVPASKSKTATRRLVKILPCLSAWLTPIARPAGPVASGTAWRRLRELRRRAGLSKWPKNALRHSFCSYHIAMWKDAASLALEMGHVGTGMIFTNYRQLVREAAAREYWEIFPPDPASVVSNAMANAELARTSSTGMERDPASGRFYFGDVAARYPRSADEYAAIYKVTPQCAGKWMRQGRPLDDAEAMHRLRSGRHQRTAAEYAALYGATIGTAKLWMRYGWPLDDEDAMRKFLATREAARGSRATLAAAVQRRRAASKIIPMAAGNRPAEETARRSA